MNTIPTRVLFEFDDGQKADIDIKWMAKFVTIQSNIQTGPYGDVVFNITVSFPDSLLTSEQVREAVDNGAVHK